MANNKVRIIGGRWRGRRLTLPPVMAVRPTPDRVRETVFNWLAADIVGATCLDAFAGSGALGFEALSRGAAQVTFIESDRKVAAQLQKTLTSLQTRRGEIIHTMFPQYFTSGNKFNIVFLDPPFHKNLLHQSVNFLQAQHLLYDNALIYIENEMELDALTLPADWILLKQKFTGELSYALYQAN